MSNESKKIMDSASGDCFCRGFPLVQMATAREAMNQQGLKAFLFSAADLLNAYADQVLSADTDPPIDTAFYSFEVKTEYRHLHN